MCGRTAHYILPHDAQSMEHCQGYVLLWLDWIGLCSVLRPHQHSIGYTGDSFYRSKDPTNSIKVLKENLQKKITKRTKKTQNTHAYTQNGKTNTAYNYNTASPLVYNNMR